MDAIHVAAPNGVGGDGAEDVFGGLEAVTNLAWRAIGTKVQHLHLYLNLCIVTL